MFLELKKKIFLFVKEKDWIKYYVSVKYERYMIDHKYISFSYHLKKQTGQ